MPAIPGNAHNHINMFLKVKLGIAQIITAHHIELHVRDGALLVPCLPKGWMLQPDNRYLHAIPFHASEQLERAG